MSDLIRDEYDIKGRMSDLVNAFQQYAQRVRDKDRLIAELRQEAKLLRDQLTAALGVRDE